MTTKHVFYVGLNDKDSHVQLVNSIDAARMIERVFAARGVDCTIAGGRGVYRHEDGTVVCEETVIVTVFEFGAPVPVAAICADLKNLLNQESIAVESTETNSALY